MQLSPAARGTMCGIATGTPVWLDQLDGRERAALRPGVPDALERRPDVLVVGGGVQGLATAMACRERGLGRILLIERDQLAAGPSGSAAGVLCPDSHLDVEGPAFVEFARASLARYEALAAEAGPELRLRWMDWLLVGPRTGDTAVAALPDVQRLDAHAVRRLVPGLGIETPGLLLSRGQAHLNPQRLAAALASRGGAVATGIEYLGLRAAGGRAEAVQTSRGDLHPGAVVFAVGLAPPGLMPVAQLRFKGHLAATRPCPVPLPVALAAPGATVTPLEDGRLLVGGDRVLDDGAPGVDPGTIGGFRDELGRLLPDAAAEEFSHAWSCARPATADRLPVVDRAPGLENVWVTAGHYTTGVLLAPATGHALATWIGSGRPPEAAAQFRLRRP
jgi:glycine/D-amino acid oxidase-like deaminating enzyme